MPKIIDNYVLERKVGQGQFGDVFKGYNKTSNQDVAIKCVRRASLKGKFYELLENEIKVLRSCNNENIIKLYDIKKTANNFYLMLEYCNEGDLMQYLKTKGYINEEEAIEYLIQILNGFKTLVKSKIMHRDFKLANILKHDGHIKIADFGFSKLLGNDNKAQTMLGSPLNMAPEVLNNEAYNNKADIWSIGTVFYEMLFGKPPFVASNMIELIKNIQKNPVQFPRKINKISDVTEDVLKKMLVVDPRKRIEWEDLFNHKIVTYTENKLKQNLEQTLKDDGSIALNMSKFYINCNKVIEHPNEIKQKEDLNNYAINMAKTGKQGGSYQGAMVKRQVERKEDKLNPQTDQVDDNNDKQNEVEEQKTDTAESISEKESVREYEIRQRKFNANRILHERNIYVFLASVAEETMNNSQIKNYDITGFLIVKKLLQLVDLLASKLSNKINIFSLDLWEQFVNSKDFKDIFAYIEKEYEVFRLYFQSMYEKLSQNPRIKNSQLDEETRIALSSNINIPIDKVLKKYLKEYSLQLIQHLQVQKKDPESLRQMWIHADRILDCQNIEGVFVFIDQKSKQNFNFKHYYEIDENLEIETLINKVNQKYKNIRV